MILSSAQLKFQTTQLQVILQIGIMPRRSGQG
ncbi:unnamed protein product, partial [Allacma fusca]